MNKHMSNILITAGVLGILGVTAYFGYKFAISKINNTSITEGDVQRYLLNNKYKGVPNTTQNISNQIYNKATVPAPTGGALNGPE